MSLVISVVFVIFFLITGEIYRKQRHGTSGKNALAEAASRPPKFTNVKLYSNPLTDNLTDDCMLSLSIDKRPLNDYNYSHHDEAP